MKLLPKQLSAESFCYYSGKSMNDFKVEMQKLFDKTNGWNFSINLQGKFTAENEFEITPKWQLIHIRGGGSREIARIRGIVFQNEFGQTEVDFKISPNTVIPVLFFIFPVIGILVLTSHHIEGDKNVAMLVGLCLIFLSPLLMLIFGQQAKMGLKDRFVDIFRLREL